MHADSSQYSPEKIQTLTQTCNLDGLPLAQRIAALSATIPVAHQGELPNLASALLSDLQALAQKPQRGHHIPAFIRVLAKPLAPDHKGQALRVLLRDWARLPIEVRERAIELAGPALATALVHAGVGTESACRLSAARFILDFTDPSLLKMAAGLLGDPDRETADAAEVALVRAALILAKLPGPAPLPHWATPAAANLPGPNPHETRAAIAMAVDGYQSHRRAGCLAAAMMILDPVSLAWASKSQDPLIRWFSDRDHPANSALRTALRRSEGPLWRQRAWEWMADESMAAAAADRVARATTLEEHEAVLTRAHLIANPARRRRLGLVPIKDMARPQRPPSPSPLPGPQLLPRLSPAARRGLPAFAAACRISDASLVLLLSELTHDPDAAVRYAACRVLPRESLHTFLNDACPAVSRSAHVRLRHAANAQPEPESPWDHTSVASRLEARRQLLLTRPAFLAELRQRMSRGTASQQLSAVMLARALSLESEMELELLALLAAPAELEPPPGKGHRPGQVAATAAAALAAVATPSSTQALHACLSHPDDRIRANAFESLLSRRRAPSFASDPALLAAAGRGAADASHRVRASVLRALLLAPVPAAADGLAGMLHDSRPLHRLAGLWATERVAAAANLDPGAGCLVPWNDFASRVADLARNDTEEPIRLRAARCAATLLTRMRSGWQHRAVAVGPAETQTT